MVANTSIHVVLQRLSRAAATLPAGALDAYVELVLQSIPRHACDMLEELLTCSLPVSAFQPAATITAVDGASASTTEATWGDKTGFQSTCISAGLWLVQQPGITPGRRAEFVARVCAPPLREEAMACEWVSAALRSQASAAAVRAFTAANAWEGAVDTLLPACIHALDSIPGVASDLSVVTALAGAPDHLVSFSSEDGPRNPGGRDPGGPQPLRLTLAAACDVVSQLVDAAVSAAASTAPVDASLDTGIRHPGGTPSVTSSVNTDNSVLSGISSRSSDGQHSGVSCTDAIGLTARMAPDAAACGGSAGNAEGGAQTSAGVAGVAAGQIWPADVVLVCHMAFLPRALAVLARGSQRGGRDRFAAVLRSLLPSVLLLRRDILLPQDRRRHAVRALWSTICVMLASDDSRRSDGYSLMLRFASLLLPPVPLGEAAAVTGVAGAATASAPGHPTFVECSMDGFREGAGGAGEGAAGAGGAGGGETGSNVGGNKANAKKVFTVLEERAFWDAVRAGMLGKDALLFKQSTYLLRKALESLRVLTPPDVPAAASESKGRVPRPERKKRGARKKGEAEAEEGATGIEGDGPPQGGSDNKHPQGGATPGAMTSAPSSQQGGRERASSVGDTPAAAAMHDTLRQRWESYFGALDLLGEFSMPLILAGLRSLVDRLHAQALGEDGTHTGEGRDPGHPITDSESLRLHARPPPPLILALERVTHDSAHLWLDFSWLQVLWVRGLRHDNPKVRYVVLQAFFGRHWEEGWLANLPEEFLSGPLLTVLAEPGSHKAFGSAGLGSVTATSAAQLYDKYTRSLPSSSRQSFALTFLSALLAASQSRVHPCSRPGLLCLLGCAHRVVAAAVADGSGAFGVHAPLGMDAGAALGHKSSNVIADASTDASKAVAQTASRDAAISCLCSLATCVKQQYNPRYRTKASALILDAVTILTPSAALLSVQQIGRIFASLPADVVEPGAPLRRQLLAWVNGVAQESTACERSAEAVAWSAPHGSCMFAALDAQLELLLASHTASHPPDKDAAAATARACEEWATVLPLVALSHDEQLSLLQRVTEVARTAYRRPYMSVDVTGRALRLLMAACRGLEGLLPADGDDKPAYAPTTHEASLERALFSLLAQSMEEVVACAGSAVGALWMPPGTVAAPAPAPSAAPSAERWAVCVLQAVQDCGRWMTRYEDRRLRRQDLARVAIQTGISPPPLSAKEPRQPRRGSPHDDTWRKSLAGLFVSTLERLAKESSWLVSHPRHYAGALECLMLMCATVRSSGMAGGLLVDTQGCLAAVRAGIASLLEPHASGPQLAPSGTPATARMDKTTRELAVTVATWKWRALDALLLLQAAATADLEGNASAAAVPSHAVEHHPGGMASSGQHGWVRVSATQGQPSVGQGAPTSQVNAAAPMLLTPNLRLQLLQHSAACLDVAGDDYAVPVLRVIRHVAKELAEDRPPLLVATTRGSAAPGADARAGSSLGDDEGGATSRAWAFFEANLLELAKSAVAAVCESRDRSYVVLSVMLTTFLQPALFIRPELHRMVDVDAGGAPTPGPLMWLVRKLLSLAERSARTGRISALHLSNLWLRHPAIAGLYVEEICHMALYGEHGVDQEFELDEDGLRVGVGGEFAALQTSLVPEMSELFRNSELFVRVSSVVLLYKLALKLEAAEAAEAAAAAAQTALPRSPPAHEAAGPSPPLPSAPSVGDGPHQARDGGKWAGASMSGGDKGDVRVIRELGQTILLKLLRASVYDPELSRDTYRKLSETHRRKIRMWQFLCVLTRFLRPNVEDEVLDLLMKGLDHTNMPSVRQYFEIFAMHYFLRFPDKIFSHIIVPLGRSDLRPQSLSSLIMISASILLHCPQEQRDALSRRLLPALVPWACSHHHNLRNFSQALLHQIFKQQIVETRQGGDVRQHPAASTAGDIPTVAAAIDGNVPAGAHEGHGKVEAMACDTLHALNDFLATNKDVKRMREAVELFFEEYNPLLKSTPQGIFCDFALAQTEAIDSPGFECVRWTLTERINNFIKETRNHIRAEVAAEQELFDREQREARELLASATQKRQEAAATSASDQSQRDDEGGDGGEGGGLWGQGARVDDDDGDGDGDSDGDGKLGEGAGGNGPKRGQGGARRAAGTAAGGTAAGGSNFQRKVKVHGVATGGGDEDVDGVVPPVPSFMQEASEGDMLEEELLLASAASEGQRLSSKRGLGAQDRWQDIIVVATFISHIPNLGGLARTCEVFRAASLVVSDLRVMQDPAFQGLSMTAEKWVSITAVPEARLMAFLERKRRDGYALMGLEQTANSCPLQVAVLPRKMVLLLGKEKEGIPVEFIQMLDGCLEIPQLGIVRSLNVHVSGAIAIWEYTRQHLRPSEEQFAVK